MEKWVVAGGLGVIREAFEDDAVGDVRLVGQPTRPRWEVGDKAALYIKGRGYKWVGTIVAVSEGPDPQTVGDEDWAKFAPGSGNRWPYWAKVRLDLLTAWQYAPTWKDIGPRPPRTRIRAHDGIGCRRR